ncbi:response regulator transcription factor (plasmid) [Clostridium botulinum]|uniref:Stage 0 sporulation protein A homolog n=1 Tax=Clostridium botulinum C/D str. DC5 TaxID=1443128 RepID=A0A0A0HX12_CLOBO|nr:LytTR family DNA-binding domain-containing protein [Clostridium botulinum]KGM93087.1 response regulator VirR [Clostridium botulinum C/D str. DC5]KOC52334.1 response regulator [Clostridium botulinum]KOC56816.1 response regulator [Clostridium botulinum]MCD3235197.1 response regulator transcription factor [Clostridium botulinum D/C]MCD3241145.1 response regulator transcription factor [Clostridium botulinum D/C]
MINIAICDDDKNIIDQMKKYIEEYKWEECIVDDYMCGEDLLECKKHFNAIFLDIDMQGIDGIETARNIRSYNKEVKIIYVTSFSEYVNLAFSVHAFGYLNKPIKKEEIHKQLDEVISYSGKKEEVKLIEFMTTEGVVRLAPKDVYYFEYANRKVKIKTLKTIYMINEKITTIAKKMEEYDFLMPHKSFSVNLFYLKNIKGYEIFMVDGSIIPLSQKRSAKFREKFNLFLEQHI